MKRTLITLGLAFVIGVGVLLMAAGPQWIQYNERVVGENSPYYTDVVNRPAKQIWGNFTSQHTVNGAHKSSIFPTPVPTVTPSEADNLFLVEHTITGTHLSSIFPTPIPTLAPVVTVTPSAGDTFFLVEHQADGTHPSSIFPTPIPTLPYPTPAPTATPVEWLYEMQTHFGSNDMHSYPLLTSTSISSAPYAVGNDQCHGGMLVMNTTGAINLPSLMDIQNNGCHTVAIIVNQNTGAVSINAGTSTSILTIGGSYTTLTSTTTPLGYSVFLRWASGISKWYYYTGRGTWTTS